MASLAVVEPSCAICGSQQYPECPHESSRLQLALDQAMARWVGMKQMREWVLNHARNEVMAAFNEMRAARYEAHIAYLQTLPCFTLFQKFHGDPPVHPSQLQVLQQQINHAQMMYKSGVDEDWRRSCLRYPEILDYFFSLVDLDLPEDRDALVRQPKFGAPLDGPRRLIKARRSSRGSTDLSNGRRKKDRRRHSRGRTPHRR